MKPDIKHHIPDPLLANYVDGTLSYADSLVIASHISLCSLCRAKIETQFVLGGVLIDNISAVPLKKYNFDTILSAATINAPSATTQSDKVLPQPVMNALNHKQPKWRRIGPGVAQHIIDSREDGTVRLLRIAPETPVPEHSHGGSELTLVLQGAFQDEFGQFNIGDVEVADQTTEHQPVAAEGDTCICLAATSDRLVFTNFLPKLLQPLFRI